MKKTLMVVSMLAGAAGAFAQGSLNWQDGQTGYDISILSPNSTTMPVAEETGNTQFDLPAGSTTYIGGWIGNTGASPGAGVGTTPASGYLGINYQNPAGFTMGLYVDTTKAALTADIMSGNPAATTTLLGGANAGLYAQGTPTYVSGLAPATAVWVGLAAWYSGGGATSYASAIAGHTVEAYVESTTTVALGGGSSAPASVVGLGLTSFSLGSVVPEPSTIALGVIGASTFLMRIRRKN
jgi:hypothetical protein